MVVAMAVEVVVVAGDGRNFFVDAKKRGQVGN